MGRQEIHKAVLRYQGRCLQCWHMVKFDGGEGGDESMGEAPAAINNCYCVAAAAQLLPRSPKDRRLAAPSPPNELRSPGDPAMSSPPSSGSSSSLVITHTIPAPPRAAHTKLYL